MDRSNRSILAGLALAVCAPSVLGQLQFDELLARRLPADIESTWALVLGDVDGDGDCDLVLGNDLNPNRLYLNDGTGEFTDATATHMPPDNDRTRAVALGDVDGDGDLDLVFGNFPVPGPGLPQTRLYVNDGSGVFTDVTAGRMPADEDSTEALALGDVDGDGDLDLVLGNSNSARGLPQQSRLYVNDGAGTFTDETAARLPDDGDQTQALALGDVDGDGDLDLVLANASPGSPLQNRLYLNDGAGVFTDATGTHMPAFSSLSFAVALGDVDCDGDLDVFLGNGGEQNRLLRNDGSGVFTDATAGRIPTDSDPSRGLALGDVDGDGDLDAVVTNHEQNRIYLNDGTGAFTDATADHLPTDQDATLAVALEDVSGDGAADLILGNSGTQNHLYLNDGEGAFPDPASHRLPFDLDDTEVLLLGDVDGDEDLDLLVGNGAQDRLLLNDGTGIFTGFPMPPDETRTEAMALGDVDGDGDLDLVSAKSGRPVAAPNRLYLNDGSGHFTDGAARLPADSDTTQAVGLGDVDGDGDLDMVIANSGSSGQRQDRLYLNDGTGTFTDATDDRMPPDNEFAAALCLADLDGDGDLDVALADGLLYLNNGAGTFTDATADRIPPGPRFRNSAAVAVGDVDGDGDLDLVYGSSAEQNYLILNDGTGTFTDATARMPVDRDLTRSISVGDVDGDGDADLILATRNLAFHISGYQNRLYLNLLRQLETPTSAKAGSEFRLDAYARYGPPRTVDVVIAYLSTDRAAVPWPPFGTIGINTSLLAGLPPFLIPLSTGTASVSFVVPDVPGLIGVPFYIQAILVQYPTLVRLTNVTTDTVVR